MLSILKKIFSRIKAKFENGCRTIYRQSLVQQKRTAFSDRKFAILTTRDDMQILASYVL